ncbi:hypothetical protein [Belnapia moabensis]|uniref:hypothetical protein n=1 Tax=Belnapia moabensis TaxID=365533 RepID=UPI0005B987C1|nr:hypothetical protein [Belnapia moabensis]
MIDRVHTGCRDRHRRLVWVWLRVGRVHDPKDVRLSEGLDHLGTHKWLLPERLLADPCRLVVAHVIPLQRMQKRAFSQISFKKFLKVSAAKSGVGLMFAPAAEASRLRRLFGGFECAWDILPQLPAITRQLMPESTLTWKPHRGYQ